MESYIIYALTTVLALAIFVPYFLKHRREHHKNYQRLKEAESLGIIRPQSQYPMINQSLCIGCGSCVKACPEGDVLGVVFGKAEIINGLRCVGHGHCEAACPVSAIKVGLGDITARDDIPVLDEYYQSNIPGLYVVGELGGIALIRNAIAQARTAMTHLGGQAQKSSNGVPDVAIVGAGPAGMTAALSAIQNNLSYVLIDQQQPGGTILQYPRRKLVMNKPVEIPLYGWLKHSEYSKENLLEIWDDIIQKFKIESHTNHRIEAVSKAQDLFCIKSQSGEFTARHVVLAMGRRGTPRKLNVPGEEKKKVAYQLIDAQSYQNRHILIVGGGDSAVEAAIGLARQKGNFVTISYRKSQFFRIKKKNEEYISRMIKTNKICPIFNSNVTEIHDDSIKLRVENEIVEIPNDDVFIFAGGIPPFKMLKGMGIQFGGERKPLLEKSF